MAQPSLLEQPVIVHTRPAIDMNDEQFFQFCQVNDDLQIERSADGDILIMAPEAGSSGLGSSELTISLGVWARLDGTGRVFGPSTGFTLPNGATRSRDVAWVRSERLDALTQLRAREVLARAPHNRIADRHDSSSNHGRSKSPLLPPVFCSRYTS